MARFDLTDFEWSIIEPLLPRKSRGVPRVDDRRVINGMLFKAKTGVAWRDLPMAPPWSTPSASTCAVAWPPSRAWR